MLLAQGGNPQFPRNCVPRVGRETGKSPGTRNWPWTARGTAAGTGEPIPRNCETPSAMPRHMMKSANRVALQWGLLTGTAISVGVIAGSKLLTDHSNHVAPAAVALGCAN